MKTHVEGHHINVKINGAMEGAAGASNKKSKSL